MLLWYAIVLSFWGVEGIAAEPPATAHTLTRNIGPQNITFRGDPLNHTLQTPSEEITYGCMTFSRPLKDRDFFLNSLALIRLLALGEPEESETPKIVRRDDARSVKVTIGGGPRGDQVMPRSRMLQIVAGVVDDMTTEYNFRSLKCDVYLGEKAQGRIVAHYEVSSPVRGKCHPTSKQASFAYCRCTDSEPLPPDITETIDPQDAESFAAPHYVLSSQSVDVLPRCQSLFSDANVIAIGDFFNIIAVGMLTMSDLAPGETVGKLDFHTPYYKPEIKIRGVQESKLRFFLRPQDVINALWVLILQELLRVDIGRSYNTVVTRIHRNVPDRGETFIGTMAIQQAKLDTTF